MRTTLDIDEDVLAAAKELAAKQRTTAGKILSDAFRRTLSSSADADPQTRAGSPYPLKNGVPVVVSRGEIITVAHVERLLEEDS